MIEITRTTPYFLFDSGEVVVGGESLTFFLRHKVKIYFSGSKLYSSSRVDAPLDKFIIVVEHIDW